MLFMAAIMAFLHHLAAFTVVSTLAVEVATFKPPLTAVQARRLQITDSIFGISAGLLLVIGLGRVFSFEKGAAYYFHNPFFLTKFGLFIVAALISIYPTRLFLSWSKDIKAGIAPTIDPARVRTARMCMMWELTAILGILFCAPMMARGL
jgi:putative membrane protein